MATPVNRRFQKKLLRNWIFVAKMSIRLELSRVTKVNCCGVESATKVVTHVDNGHVGLVTVTE